MENHEMRDKIIEEYWLKQLGGDLPKIALPSFNLPQNGRTSGRACIQRRIPEEIISGLLKISRNSDPGLFILVLTCINTLLYKYTGCSDILVGTASNTAQKPLHSQLLFCRNSFDDGITFRELNERVKKTVTEMFGYQEYSYDHIYNKLLIARGVTALDIFHVAFIYEKIQSRPEILDKFDVVMILSKKEDGMYFNMEYNGGAYTAELMAQLLENLFHIMGNFWENLERKMPEVDIVSEKEKQIYSFNNTKVDFKDKDRLLHQLFEAQAEKTPEACAVLCGNKRLTYRQLNERANQLARLLKSKGVARDGIVGILAENSLETVTGIMAILKAGGAYLPIDPELNESRLRYILKNSGISLLLSSSGRIPPADFSGETIDLSREALYTGDGDNLPVGEYPGDLAYVIYTSGTTGNPKGVMIEHRSIVNQILGLLRMYRFDEELNHILMAPFTFDPSVQQVFLPLVSGGRLFLIPKEMKMNPGDYWSFVADNHINIINTVPSLMEVLLEHDRVNTMKFKFIILAGEVFSKDLYTRLESRGLSEKIINIYGPTEATINTTLFEGREEDIGAAVPIGRPLDNYSLYILDSHMHLLPIGAVGEIYISGIGLARGYLNDDELTRQKFVSGSLSPGGDRMYKTGDLARWRPDGIIEFIGRADQQIKIRGMRVELGEIESLLTSSLWVKEAAVLYNEHYGLAACYTLKEPSMGDGTQEKIREYLKNSLPGHMVPGRLIHAGAMPVTENGKIDRKALAALVEKAGAEREYVAPGNDLEEKIAAVWKDVLGIERVGIHDSFFEIGGNSLLIVKLQSKLNKALGAELSVAQLFSYHTVSMLSNYLSAGAGQAEKTGGRKNRPGPEGDNQKDTDVAIIGIACRMPLAENAQAFWENLCKGVDAVRSIPAQRMQDLNRIANMECDDPDKYPRAAYLERIDLFDAAFFNIPPNEAKLMDPHQRLFLEVTWEALENAGFTAQSISGTKTGVFAASSRSRYVDLIQSAEPSAIPGNLYSAIAGRISYIYDLKGPSQMIDTACSSSLVAVHYACRTIRSGDCDMAVAGGINIYLTALDRNLYEVGIASPDGRSKTFDESADGTGGGEGVGVIVLKSLEKALEDKDNIWAVIKGSAMNSDGRTNGITAPSAAAQASLLKETWRKFDVNPETISYIETHGTGTKLGDPIEIEGITEAFKDSTDKKQFCSVGSVKTNIGHLDSAAGIAGLIKTVLALKHRMLPATLHFKKPNPYIDFCNSPVYINSELRPWETADGVRRAGVSSFGLSGTNCHVILEEYPRQGAAVRQPVYPLNRKRYWIEAEPLPEEKAARPALAVVPEAADIVKPVFSLGESLLERVGFEGAPGLSEAMENFSSLLILDFFNQWGIFQSPREPWDFDGISGTVGIIPQYKKLLKYLLLQLEKNGVIAVADGNMRLVESYRRQEIEPVYQGLLEKYPKFQGSFKIVKYCMEHYPRVLTGKMSPLSVLFPDGTPGFLQTFANKGRAMGDCYEFLAAEALKSHIRAYGGRKLKILEVGAGAGTLGKQIFPSLENENLEYYYTDIGRSILSNAQKQFSGYPFVKYRVFDIEKNPFEQGFSEGEFDMVVALNVVHATRSVKNSLENLKKVLARDGSIYIIEKVINEPEENLVWGLTDGWWLFEDEQVRKHSPLMNISQWKDSLGKAGFSNPEVFPEDCGRQESAVTALFVAGNSKTGQEYRDYLFRVNWIEKDMKDRTPGIPRGLWLVFCDKTGIGEQLAERLESEGCRCIRIEAGAGYRQVSEDRYILSASGKDYDMLMEALGDRIKSLAGIIQLWACDSPDGSGPDFGKIEAGQAAGVFSLFYLMKALQEHHVEQVLDIRLVSNFAYHFEGDRFLCPEKAPLHGFSKVVSQENSRFQSYSLDIDSCRYSAGEISRIITDEIAGNRTDYTVAYRGKRFVQELGRLHGAGYPVREMNIRDGGVYVVTGGAGGLGLEICKYIAGQAKVNLVVVNRSPLPDRSCWSSMAQQDCPEAVYRRIKAFAGIEASGSQVAYYAADVTSESAMKAVLDEAREKYGKISGIVHCAAASGDKSRLIKEQTFEGFREVLSPKVKGVVVLDSLTREEELDFFAVFSSIASLWGGASGADYAAANAFLDSFSSWRNALGKPTVSLNWYAWEGLTGPGCIGYMSVPDATSAFGEALKCCLDQVVIGKFDMKILGEWSPMLKIQIAENILGPEKSNNYREVRDERESRQEPDRGVVLKGRANGEDYTQLEKEVAGIWEEVLGYEEIDIHANFFGIGGDSLSVLKVLKLVNERLDENVEVGDLFSHTTVSQLAKFLESRQKKDTTDDPLMSLIKNVKQKKISVDRAMKGYEKYE